MFSHVYNINKRLEQLDRKEHRINAFYDPKGSAKEQRHRHFLDIYQDYNEDIKNYGFSRFSWNRDEKRLKSKAIQGSTVKATQRSTLKNFNVIPFSNKAKSRNEKRIDGSAKKNENEMQKLTQKYKFWRYTKKFDVNLKSLVRNTSALSKIYLEGVKNNEDPVDLEEYQADEREVEENVQNFMKMTYETTNIYKQGPSDHEKRSAFNGFKESIAALKEYEKDFAKPSIRKASYKPQKASESMKKRPFTAKNPNPSFMNPGTRKKPLIQNDPTISTDEQTLNTLRSLNSWILSEPTSAEPLKSFLMSGQMNKGEGAKAFLIDLRSKKSMHFNEIWIENGQFYNERLGIIDFERVALALGNLCEEKDKIWLYNGLIYLLFYDSRQILCAKMLYLGEYSIKFRDSLCNAILSFYMMVMLAFDRSRKLSEIHENSKYFIKNGVFGSVFSNFFLEMKSLPFYIEDKNKPIAISLTASIESLLAKKPLPPANLDSDLGFPGPLEDYEPETPFLFSQRTVLPVKLKPSVLKYRPKTAISEGKSPGIFDSPVDMREIMSKRMRTNFMKTPMKGVYEGRGDHSGDLRDFRTITVEGQKY